jgi:hypothetical protein
MTQPASDKTNVQGTQTQDPKGPKLPNKTVLYALGILGTLGLGAAAYYVHSRFKGAASLSAPDSVTPVSLYSYYNFPPSPMRSDGSFRFYRHDLEAVKALPYEGVTIPEGVKLDGPYLLGALADMETRIKLGEPCYQFYYFTDAATKDKLKIRFMMLDADKVVAQITCDSPGCGVQAAPMQELGLSIERHLFEVAEKQGKSYGTLLTAPRSSPIFHLEKRVPQSLRNTVPVATTRPAIEGDTPATTVEMLKEIESHLQSGQAWSKKYALRVSNEVILAECKIEADGFFYWSVTHATPTKGLRPIEEIEALDLILEDMAIWYGRADISAS